MVEDWELQYGFGICLLRSLGTWVDSSDNERSGALSHDKAGRKESDIIAGSYDHHHPLRSITPLASDILIGLFMPFLVIVLILRHLLSCLP